MSERAKELEPTLDRRLRWLADELLQCSCDEAYTSRGLIAPDCNGHDGYAETIAEARTRLAELRKDAERMDWPRDKREAALSEARARYIEAQKRAATPTPAALREWAEWFDDPRKPLVTVVPGAGNYTAGYLLRRIADALEEAT